MKTPLKVEGLNTAGLSLYRGALEPAEKRRLQRYLIKCLEVRWRLPDTQPKRKWERRTDSFTACRRPDLLRLIRHFCPAGSRLNHFMVQGYKKGYQLPQHTDGSDLTPYSRVVIVNLTGHCQFQMSRSDNHGGSTVLDLFTVRGGDILVMEGLALSMKHGVPSMPTDRSNIVIRYSPVPKKLRRKKISRTK